MTEFYKRRLIGYLCALALLTVCLLPVGLGDPGEAVPPSTEATASTAPSYSVPSYNPVVGMVRIYTCDEGLYDAFSALAARYYQETGFPVQVQLSEYGCQAGLQQAMSSGEAPTLFCMHGRTDLEKWADSLYDLSGTPVLGKLVSPEFALEMDGKRIALTADTQGYGLIYNASLLARAGFTRSDITDFDQLQLVSRYITSQGMHFSAFAAPDLEVAEHKAMACLLAGLGQDAEDLRGFWDLYIQNNSTDARGLTAFLEGSSVFCLGGSWDYAALEALGSSNLDILPAFTPAGGSLGFTVELCWGVNAGAARMDIQRTLEFLNWLVTAKEKSPAPIDSLGLFAPFADAAGYSDPLEKKLREYMRQEPVSVAWKCCGGLNKKELAALGEALTAYAADPTQENWDAVAAILPE